MPFAMRYPCKTCNGHYPLTELIAGLCPYCLQKRSESYNPEKYEIPKFTDGSVYRCMECGKSLHKFAYLHWVTDAATFGLLCVSCSDKKVRTDAQFRNTPAAFQEKVQ